VRAPAPAPRGDLRAPKGRLIAAEAASGANQQGFGAAFAFKAERAPLQRLFEWLPFRPDLAIFAQRSTWGRFVERTRITCWRSNAILSTGELDCELPSDC
jgi:hypothetical protein